MLSGSFQQDLSITRSRSRSDPCLDTEPGGARPSVGNGTILEKSDAPSYSMRYLLGVEPGQAIGEKLGALLGQGGQMPLAGPGDTHVFRT